MKKLGLVVVTVVAAYITTIGALWAMQRDLIFNPDRAPHVPPSQYQLLNGVTEISLQTADGIDLKAWYAPARAGRPTVVIFPGKSSSLSNQGYRVWHFRDADMGVLLLAYRGYSGNGGTPSEQGLYADARAALAWLDLEGIDDQTIVLYGASLGSGVATRMAAETSVGAVVLEAPYTSIADVAARRYPFVPVRWLLRDRFDSLALIGELTEPLLIMHGTDDTVIPQEQGRRLLAAAQSPKAGFWPEGVGHNDLFDFGGFEVARRFIDTAVGMRATELTRAAPESRRLAR